MDERGDLTRLEDIEASNPSEGVDPSLSLAPEPLDLGDESSEPLVTSAEDNLAPDNAGEPEAFVGQIEAEVPAPKGLEGVKVFSENYTHVAKPIQASFPFTVLIEGLLGDGDRGALLTLINENALGIREVDLEPQFEQGRILIPRVSEYAAVLIAQTLRDSGARLKVGPSEKVYSVQPSDSTQVQMPSSESSQLEAALEKEVSTAHQAFKIPITTTQRLPYGEPFRVLGTISASITVPITTAEQKESKDYQTLIERLTRELQFKAYFKGADGIVGLTITQHPIPGLPKMKLLALANLVVTKDGESG